MSRCRDLNEKELNIFKKKVNNLEIFKNFFRDYYLRNLRIMFINYYKNEF